MTEIGRVTKIEGGTVTVHCRPSAACHSCNSGMCNAKSRELTARNSGNLPLHLDDYAEVFLPSSQAVKAGFQVFIFPLVLFALFYIGVQRIFGVSDEGPLVLAGLGGLALGFLAAFFLARRGQKLPEVLRVIGEAELKELAAEEAAEAGGNLP